MVAEVAEVEAAEAGVAEVAEVEVAGEAEAEVAGVAGVAEVAEAEVAEVAEAEAAGEAEVRRRDVVVRDRAGPGLARGDGDVALRVAVARERLRVAGSRVLGDRVGHARRERVGRARLVTGLRAPVDVGLARLDMEGEVGSGLRAAVVVDHVLDHLQLAALARARLARPLGHVAGVEPIDEGA